MGYSRLLLVGAAEGAGERRSVGAYADVFVFVCSLSQSQNVSKETPQQLFWHLEEIALKWRLAGCTGFA